MQKSYSIGYPEERHFPALKKLWEDVFGDSEKVINNFFDETSKKENIFCAFYGDEPVSVMYVVESNILSEKAECKAYYVYAVCTKEEHRGNSLMKKVFSFLESEARKRLVSYLFLVPAEESLFSLYESIGFSVGFTNKETLVKKPDSLINSFSSRNLSYEEYKGLREKYINVPQAILNESGFNSFYVPVGSDMNCISLNEGYVLYEKENEKVIVHELCGEKEALLDAVFSATEADEILLREQTATCGKPYGMIKSLDGSPLFENGFFGISYGG